MGMRGQRHAPAALYPREKTWYPLYRMLDGPQGRSGQVRKISPSPGFDSQTVQPVARRCTHYATRPTVAGYRYVFVSFFVLQKRKQILKPWSEVWRKWWLCLAVDMRSKFSIKFKELEQNCVISVTVLRTKIQTRESYTRGSIFVRAKSVPSLYATSPLVVKITMQFDMYCVWLKQSICAIISFI